jgi:hypothetical protein
MQVDMSGDGPVTLVLDSDELWNAKESNGQSIK